MLPPVHRLHLATSGPQSRPGQIYTPAPLAQFLAQVAFQERPAHRLLTVLDPACGDGALLAACRELCPLAAPDTSSLRLCGVETDPVALAHAKARLPEATLFCADALTGPGWNDPPSPDWIEAGLSWASALPDVAAAGGFDLVIANPPFIRERSAKALFDAVAATPLGRTFREPRMDYWFYFFHRALDLLRPGGSLTFIVPSYFAASTGAERLRRRLETELDLLDLIDLAAAPVFPGVSGQHLIFRARKHFVESPGAARSVPPVRLSYPRDDAPLSDLSVEQVVRDLSTCHFGLVTEASQAPRWTTGSVPATQLCSATRLQLRPRVAPVPADQTTGEANQVLVSHGISSLRTVSLRTLGDFFDVRQGIAENPPRVTARHVREFPHLGPAGTGVFVLSHAEVESLELSAAERSLLRPYYEARAVRRYALIGEPAGQLLYLRRDTCPDLAACPALERHLVRFRQLLERRREVVTGAISWWHLHWPREERLFTDPRILAQQMGTEPRFALVDSSPTFVNFSVNLICARDEPAASLAVAIGLLNSRFAAAWFKAHAKRRGVALEINGHLLKRFPWPDCHPALLDELAALVRRRRDSPSEEALALETAIDELVDRAYQNHPAGE
jgi:adenine-specific DNA-methyltransferase